MKFKGTVWMAALFLGLVLYYFLVDIPAEKKQNEEKERAEKILLFETDQVEEFILKKKDVTIHLKRQSPKDWELLKPVQAKADSPTASSFLSLLKSARFSRVVEDSAKDLSVYGLKEPSMEITLQLKDKNKKTLLVGDDHPMNQYLYVKRHDGNKVLLAGANRKDFDKSVFDFRDKSLLQFKNEEVATIKFQNDGKSFELSKLNEQWEIIHGRKSKGDADEVIRFLGLVRNFKVKKFLDENPDSLKDYGLDTPSARLTLETGKDNNPLTLLVGNKLENEGFYGKIESANNVVLFGKQLVKTLSKMPVDFMPKTLLDFKQEDVSQIHLQTQEEKILIAREKEDAWKIIEPIEADVDLSTLNSLLFDLKAARVNEYVNTSIKTAELFGLDMAKKVLTIDLGGDKSWTLELGNKSRDGQHYFARRAGEESIFTIGSDTVEKLFRSLHDLKNKKLLSFDKDAVNKISIEYPEKTFELQKSNENWSLTNPEKIKKVQGFIGKDILWSLRGLEYESIVKPSLGDEDSGLNRPTVSITVWTEKDLQVGKVMVGKKVENKAEYYARVDGDSNLYKIKALLLESLHKDLKKFNKQ
jgi:Domain of unknown function (DUF4340)